MKKKLIIIGLTLSVLVLGGCSAKNQYDTERGRGDAPVGAVDNGPKDVIQMPDRFSNVATTCDGHGHRIYVTTKSDSSRFLAVIDDPSCGK